LSGPVDSGNAEDKGRGVACGGNASDDSDDEGRSSGGREPHPVVNVDQCGPTGCS